jgi:hypothetical protein
MHGKFHWGFSNPSMRPLRLYTLKAPLRRKPISVIPQRSAVATARLEGAPTAASSGTPAIEAFCTNSKLARPLTSIMESLKGVRYLIRAWPTNLSTALWRPTSSRNDVTDVQMLEAAIIRDIEKYPFRLYLGQSHFLCVYLPFLADARFRVADFLEPLTGTRTRFSVSSLSLSPSIFKISSCRRRGIPICLAASCRDNGGPVNLITFFMPLL